MTVKEKAYAKINLYLDVTGRRADGFHDIVTLMHSVSLCDELTLTADYSNKTDITVTSNDKSLEVNENNLIYKSALKYISFFGISATVNVKLTKRIPIGAGLGGGSSDAAATLRAMNKIFGLATSEQLLSMSAELGSDVPFCLYGGCAICTGRGEEISPACYSGERQLVIAIGKERVSTPRAYSLLDERYEDFKDGGRDGCPFSEADIRAYNIFESVINIDEIDSIKEIMVESGAKQTLMSGSGPSVWGSFVNASDAAVAKAALEKQGFAAFNCQLIKEKI